MILKDVESKVQLLLGSLTVDNKPLSPFDSLVCEFLSDCSEYLRGSAASESFPDILTFAFFCRRANIAKLKENHFDGKPRLGLGVVFHIAPANVPINFAYSLVFGLLSGNANLVRVPTKPFSQTSIVCDAMNFVLKNKNYASLRSMLALFRYEACDEITAALSGTVDARLIWGGNQSIRTIRKHPIRDRGVDIAFADRYSICVIDSHAIGAAKDSEIYRLAEGFFNDTYLMDQNACSSPHILFWMGEGVKAAKLRFWEAVYKIVKKKYELRPIQAIDKLEHLCRDAIQLDSRSFIKHGSEVFRVEMSSAQGLESVRGGSGYFYEIEISSLEGVLPVLESKCQTLSYFGISKEVLLKFIIDSRVQGVDRIVPLGSALSMGLVWDGRNMIEALSRIIDVNWK